MVEKNKILLLKGFRTSFCFGLEVATLSPSLKNILETITAFSLSSSWEIRKKSHLFQPLLDFKDQTLSVFSTSTGYPSSPSPHLFHFEPIPLKYRRLELPRCFKMIFSNALKQTVLLFLPSTDIHHSINPRN